MIIAYEKRNANLNFSGKPSIYKGFWTLWTMWIMWIVYRRRRKTIVKNR
jgi:hypothetical protein